jgi:predicted RNA-binding Zn ribbon-like protein
LTSYDTEPMAKHLELIRDFVNSVDVEEGRDEFETPAGLARWLSSRGLAARALRASEPERRRAIAMREALRALIAANNGEAVDEANARAVLDRQARRSGLVVTFTPILELAPGKGGVNGALGQIVAAAAKAMANGTWARLKACRAETCRWAFVDSARNRSRAWCSMRVCGNREKARVYRRRHARAT